MLCGWRITGAGGGGRRPRIGPFWFTPVNLNRICGGVGSARLALSWAIDVESGASESDSSSGTGAMPHRPSTQPPIRRPIVDDLRAPGVAVELVLVLSAEMTDVDSKERLLPAATEARREREDGPGALARSAVIIGAERTGGVETSSMLGETMRCGIRMPGCQSPMRVWRLVGV